MPPRPCLAIDLTALIRQPLGGIQRVTQELTPRLAALAHERGADLMLTHSLAPRLYPIGRWSPEACVPLGPLMQLLQRGEGVWGRRRALPGWLRPLARACVGTLRNVRPAAILGRHLRAWLAEWRGLPEADLGPDDRLVSFAAGPVPLRVPPRIDPGNVLAVLHDLIPLRHGQYVPPAVSVQFAANLLPLVYPRGPRFVTATDAARLEIEEVLVTLTGRRPEVGRVSWGYDNQRFYPDPDPHLRRRLGLPEDAFLVLAVSSQDPRKRSRHVEAAVRCLGEQESAHGLFTGHQPAAADLAHRHLGFVSDDALRRLYSTCDAFVHWSAADGFGLPVIEALACGATVVVPPDNAALVEVGGGAVVVPRSATILSLVRTLEELCATRRRRPAPNLTAYDWDRSALDLDRQLWEAEARPRTLRAA